ncbi:ferric uptake regulation protein [mine drainage metagenome]|uniref:Ferric uptake regulation protein n=1 Tax=mine drainage metagenome TaxID=410659 RepID=A0A1J5PXY1_9ZZZZ
MPGDVEPHEIRQRGLRLTPQRELVLAAVRELGHSTPEEISAHVRIHHPGINLSTVYRNLETLEKAGFVVHSHLGHGGATFHAADEASHLHLVCGECGNVSEAELEIATEFVATLVAEHGFKTDITHFAIYGECASCATK